MPTDPIIILIAILIALPIALIIGAAVKKIDGDDGKPWEHDAFKGRWE